ncbi:hypothetical protein POM88_021826 [Heracleum sosnowskyi]|uniref:RRM domain-containing protein n=1 Tax=Heracleum sosnowskyi TaxID=360622 RepID=A0AAD8MSW5_9APIA|nr:hypothetical protein POM88_021826 [Heracleum sosnowskyi]
MERRQRDVRGEKRNFEFQTRFNGRMLGWERKWHQEREAVAAAEKGNKEILRYLVNRIYRIKRTIGLKEIQQVIDGDSNAIERALRKMLLYKWEGPVALEAGGDEEGLRMASNQIYYNSLRNLKKKEYEDDFNSKTYVQAFLNNGKGNTGDTEKGGENKWTVVSYRKRRNTYSHQKIKDSINTVFVAKIPQQAKTKDIWGFFSKVGEVKDIILPRKRDKYGNIIGFVKTKDLKSAKDICRMLKIKKCMVLY